MKRLVLYHDDADGFGAALAAWLTHGEEAEYRAVQYGQEPPDVMGRDVAILDFSYKRPVLEAMKRQAKSLVVLDHHQTAKANLAGLEYTHFDQQHSGCVMAWNYYMPGKDMPDLFSYIQDRDLWKWSLPQSREVSAALASHSRDFHLWAQWLDTNTLEPLMCEGAAILRYQAQVIAAHVKAAHPMILDGREILSVNATVLQSEIGQELAKGRPFSVTWMVRDGQRVFSLRSALDGLDVSEIAKRHGGGGHPHAAGFTEPCADLPEGGVPC